MSHFLPSLGGYKVLEKKWRRD